FLLFGALFLGVATVTFFSLTMNNGEGKKEIAQQITEQSQNSNQGNSAEGSVLAANTDVTNEQATFSEASAKTNGNAEVSMSSKASNNNSSDNSANNSSSSNNSSDVNADNNSSNVSGDNGAVNGGGNNYAGDGDPGGKAAAAEKANKSAKSGTARTQTPRVLG